MKRFLSLGLLVLLPSVAHAAPIQWTAASGGNGHYYDLVNCTNATGAQVPCSWDAANTAATSRSYLGMAGHLATLTSAGENAFVLGMIAPSPQATKVWGPWLGGYQFPLNSANNAGWTWVTGEPWGYTYWNAGEPNGNLSENYLHFTRNPASLPNPKWNDVPLAGGNQINAYVLEFESVPEPASLLLLGLGLTFAATRMRRG